MSSLSTKPPHYLDEEITRLIEPIYLGCGS
jgi:hypothetical protein